MIFAPSKQSTIGGSRDCINLPDLQSITDSISTSAGSKVGLASTRCSNDVMALFCNPCTLPCSIFVQTPDMTMKVSPSRDSAPYPLVIMYTSFILLWKCRCDESP